MKKLISMLSIMGVMMSSMVTFAMEDDMMDGYGFDDVTGDTHYNQAVKWAKGQGYFYGQGGTMDNPSDTFGPDMTFNRYELAVVTVRVAGYDLVEETDCFGDEVLADWAAQAVCTLQAEGVVQGKLNEDGERYYDGAAAVTNAEVAKMSASVNLGGLPAEATDGPWYGPLDEWVSGMNLVPDMVTDMNAPAKRQHVADFLARMETYASGSTEEEKWMALDDYLMMYDDNRHMWGYNTPENRGEDLSTMRNLRYQTPIDNMDEMAVKQALETPGYTTELMGLGDYEDEVEGMAAMKYMDGNYYLHATASLPELEENYYYLAWVVEQVEDGEDNFQQLDKLMYDEETEMYELYYMKDMDYSDHMVFVVSREMVDGTADDRVLMGQGEFMEYMEEGMYPEGYDPETVKSEAMAVLGMPMYYGMDWTSDYEVMGKAKSEYDSASGMHYTHVGVAGLPELEEGYYYEGWLVKKEEGMDPMKETTGELMWHVDDEMYTGYSKHEGDYSEYMYYVVTKEARDGSMEGVAVAEVELMELMPEDDYYMELVGAKVEMPDYTAELAGEEGGDYAEAMGMAKMKYYEGYTYVYAYVEDLPMLEDDMYYHGMLVKEVEGEDNMYKSTENVLMYDEDAGRWKLYAVLEGDYSEYMTLNVTMGLMEGDNFPTVATGMYEMYEEMDGEEGAY